MKLYEIEQGMQSLLKKEDLSNEELDIALQLDDELHIKLDNMIAYATQQILTVNSYVEHLKEKIEFAKKELNKAERLKDFALLKMQQYGITELKTKHFLNVKVANAGVRPVIINEEITIETVPPEFVKQSLSYDKKAIRENLEAGEQLPFAKLGEQTKILKIKG